MLRLLVSLSLLVTASCGGRIDVEPSTSIDTSATTPAGSAEPPPQPESEGADDAARTACRACRGEWGRHGLSSIEACNCRTTDAGAACADSAECDGQCLADAAREIVVEIGPPRRGFWLGQCSELVTSYGCHAVLSDGYNLGEPVLLDDGLPLRCLD